MLHTNGGHANDVVAARIRVPASHTNFTTFALGSHCTATTLVIPGQDAKEDRKGAFYFPQSSNFLFNAISSSWR